MKNKLNKNIKKVIEKEYKSGNEYFSKVQEQEKKISKKDNLNLSTHDVNNKNFS